VLAASFKIFRFDFLFAQTMVTLTAMTTNFLFNNFITYYDRRLRGVRFFTGLVTFYLICALAVIANVGVANFVFERDYTWWVAGAAGALIGSVWNYAASALFTSGRR
jgi:dolichol-phosphate mannosyltransferase